MKIHANIFSFMIFGTPLYILDRNDPKFGLTSWTVRILIVVANHIRIKLWTRLITELMNSSMEYNAMDSPSTEW